jgi:hypothetical protein
MRPVNRNVSKYKDRTIAIRPAVKGSVNRLKAQLNLKEGLALEFLTLIGSR